MDKNPVVAIKPPSPAEKRGLRAMIIAGLFSILFLFYSLLQRDVISNYLLYWFLMVTMIYFSLKFLHEWYHYFSISVNKVAVTDKVYSVDIFTTYCAGEPFDMLENTLVAIQQISYKHTAWCCDEADDPAVKELCQRLNIRHVTRTKKINAKAGNINNALQYATGELCVVLDPDHIPVPEFLDRVVAYFDDPSIGFVQVVQAYYNQTESLVAKGAAQQTYQFYGPMMMGMNSYGTVQAIGANCTFRRTALDSIGGHASGLSEDMHTAMQMHAKGWRSIYVPEIITRGLVPATMSSYFKQQLKWSRGTWELLVTTYPKLFTKFTWRQKIHYATLPFHYLSGIIFLINFLIPVISLFSGSIPLKMDVVSFALAAFPLFSLAILIRHSVQKFVAEESDRGFHLVGGILQIGTWWIHTVGFVYTILRKKVPYIPTPKNDNEPLPLILNLPNILIAVISLVAIIYGLWYDTTPYTIFMVGLASLQILFILFILSISGYSSKTSKASIIAGKIRKNTWLIIQAHGILRRFSLPLSFLVIIVFVFGYFRQQQLPDFLPAPVPGLEIFYRGIHQPGFNLTGKTGAEEFVFTPEKKSIGILSFDCAWGYGESNRLDSSLLKKVYAANAVPMLVWMPWQYDSATGAHKDTARLNHILSGRYDSVITSFAKQLSALDKPVFLVCSGKSVGDKSPLLVNEGNPEEFVQAWKYVHRVFENTGAGKVIWVWTAADTTLATGYFPGNGYVDWLNVQLSDSVLKMHAGDNSFDSLYRPFHQQLVFRSGLPVMFIQSGSNYQNNTKWWKDAWNNIDTSFKEIKSVIVDGGIVRSEQKTTQPMAFTNFFSLPGSPAASLPMYIPPKAPNDPLPPETDKYKLPVVLKSVIYNKGYYWFRNRHTLQLKTLQHDVAAMKEIGINTVMRTMPGFYDDNLGNVLKERQMNLIPRFSLLATPEVVGNSRMLKEQKEKMLKLVKVNLKKKYIIAWSIGDDVLFNLGTQLFKPDYFDYQQKYVAWLADVCREIRLLDSVRPIIMDLRWDQNGHARYLYYRAHVPLINNYMLVADDSNEKGFKDALEPGMSWGQVDVKFWPKIDAVKHAGIIPAWQDMENTDFISMKGLLDMDGRKKHWYRYVKSYWGNAPLTSSPIPEIRILRPAKKTIQNSSLVYHLMYSKDSLTWRLFNTDAKDIKFEWYLVRTDQYQNTMFIKKVGTGPSIALKIPGEPQYYNLYVEAVLGDEVKMIRSTLNTPLY